MIHAGPKTAAAALLSSLQDVCNKPISDVIVWQSFDIHLEAAKWWIKTNELRLTELPFQVQDWQSDCNHISTSHKSLLFKL